MPDDAGAVHGAPCWVSLMTHDLDAAMRFYESALGWTYRPGFRDQEQGYQLALTEGRAVAGLGMTAQTRTFAPAWTAYFQANSVNEVAGRIQERGGTVAVGPLPFGTGRVLWAADRQDARFGVWEGDPVPGWRMRRLAGAPARLQLVTGDAFGAAMFYGGVFAWDTREPDRVSVRFESDHVVLSVDGHHVADLWGGAVEEAPDPTVRPQWHVYFCVDDVDEVAARTEAAGGSVVQAPELSHFGRVAGLRDPEGALFHVTSEHT
ncbi:VOC family protein [Streptomyces sp. GSL17-111]|uniref:VOC family protein n=1 Tax=Streptomyces sp. GSL17-111 TaxID=3121596 RepID=UPI0030F49680